jgi:hypothetical protein
MIGRFKDVVKRFESLHRAAGKARWYFERHIKYAPLAIKTNRALRKHNRLAFDIGGSIGLGAILSHAAFTLRVGSERNVDVALRFTSPIYRPADGPEDWLDCYFDRLGSQPGSMPIIRSDGLRFDYKTERDHHLLWSYLRIKPEFIRAAADLTGPAPFVAIHYRGSDKYMEGKRASADAVLRRAESEMARNSLDRIFIASDEASFVERAKDRFGRSAFWLPCKAMASGSIAAHFSASDGGTKAREALITMAALSQADICVRTPSYLSEWARTLSDKGSILIA